MRRPSRLSDALCVLACVVASAVLLRFGDAGLPRPAAPPALTWPYDGAIGLACGVSLVYRNRRPLLLALLLIPAGALAGSATPALAVTVFAVAVDCRARIAVAVAVADVASVIVYFAQQSDPRYPLGVDLVLRGGVIASALGWGLFAGARRRLIASLRERADRLEAEQQLRIDGARLTERARIAREMHDVLAHRLSLVSLHAGALEVRADAEPEEVSTAAAVIRANAHSALQELRAIIGVLRDTASFGTAPQPSLADLPELAAEAGTKVELSCSIPEDLDPAMARTVYRVVQEGLTNARKHAPGAPVTVLVEGSHNTGITVRVTNPRRCGGVSGVSPVCGTSVIAGASGIPGAGVGLAGLAERVHLSGGELTREADDDTFRLTARLPWPAAS